MTTVTDTTETLSAECTLARTPGYEDVHAWCRQLDDVPLPHSTRVLLVHRCRCSCHRQQPPRNPA
ncbi:hypothetical protein [Streptomyces sp. NPDC051677]|uniref:hypothetical protein n=1 Tax=Streptomyces sp. NPDC051677 TaxID=3365669 RepID=UPI0037D46316